MEGGKRNIECMDRTGAIREADAGGIWWWILDGKGGKVGGKVHHGAVMAFSTRVAVVGGIIMVARGQTAQRQAETADAMALGRAMSKREADDMGGGLAEGEGHCAKKMAQ